MKDVGGAYSSPGLGVSRWPWRGVGVDENWRVVWRIGVKAFLWATRHDDVLRFASLIPRCDVAVQLLDLLENFRRLDDAPVALDENPSERARRLMQVRRDAMMLDVKERRAGRESGTTRISQSVRWLRKIIPKSVRRQRGARTTLRH
jgi:hypothetical protein